MTGGAEISCQTVVKVGLDCGYDIKVITQETELEEIIRAFQESDFAILNNIFAFSGVQIKVMLAYLFSEQFPYAKYEHDHREIARKEFSRPLFQRSKLNVFLSPMHRDNHKRELDCDGICLPLAINTNDYVVIDGNVSRETNSAVICNVRHFKTWRKLQQFIDEHSEMTFTVMGERQVVTGRNVNLRSMVPHKDMPGVYAEHEYLVHILDGLGAGERVIFDGLLG